MSGTGEEFGSRADQTLEERRARYQRYIEEHPEALEIGEPQDHGGVRLEMFFSNLLRSAAKHGVKDHGAVKIPRRRTR